MIVKKKEICDFIIKYLYEDVLYVYLHIFLQ